MDKETIIASFQKKIDSFFEGKRKTFGESELKLIMAFKKSSQQLDYEFYVNNAFNGREKLADILRLNFLEKMATSIESIEQSLKDRMIAFAVSNSINPQEIALRILPGGGYHVLNNRKVYQEIELNEII